MRSKPTLAYGGVTVILSNPGRFDRRELLEGPSGTLHADACKPCKTSRYAMDIRDLSCHDPLLPNTKVVLLCGERALSISGRRGTLAALRGSPISSNGLTYIPTFHPQDASDIHQNYEAHLNPLAQKDDDENEDDSSTGKDHGVTSRRNYAFWYCADVRKAVDIARNGLRTNVCSHEIIHDLDEAAKLLRASAGQPLFLDIETDPETASLLCVGFSNSANRIYVAPIRDWRGNLCGQNPKVLRFILAISEAFSNASVVVLHNALFDLFVLLWRYKVIPPPQDRIWDTMVAHYRLYIGLEKSLGHCVSLYTHQPYHKDEGIFRPSNYEQWKQLLLYNAKDVEATALVYYAQQVQAAESLATHSIAAGNSLIRPLLLKSFRGLLVDIPTWTKGIDDAMARSNWIETKIIPRLAGKPLNPRSPKAVGEWLYKDHTFPPPRGSESATGKRQLFKLSLKYPAPLIKAILAARHVSKEASQARFELWREQYATCSYTTAKVVTFRLSSRKLLDRWGTNLQNWSKRMRRIVIPHPGNIFVQVDQSGAEARIVAFWCRPDSQYRQLFVHRIKPHVYVAMWLFRKVWAEALGESMDRFLNCPIAELRNQPRWKELDKLIKASDNNPPAQRYYYMAKQTCHSGNYGIGPGEFCSNVLEKSDGQIFLTERQGEEFLTTYRQELFPEIVNDYHAFVRRCVYKDRLLVNALGFPYVIRMWKIEDQDFKKFLAWIPQSTVGCITCEADMALQRKLDSGELTGFAILQNNHDSLLVECPVGTENAVAAVVQQHMNVQMVNPFGDQFGMESEASVGPNWYEMKSLS